MTGRAYNMASGGKAKSVPSMSDMMAGAGPYRGPQGYGFVVSVKSDYSDDIEHHHFLTHDENGEPMKMAKHFVMTEHKDRKGPMAG